MILIFAFGVLIIIGAVVIGGASLLRGCGSLVALGGGVVVIGLLGAVAVGAVGFRGREDHKTSTVATSTTAVTTTTKPIVTTASTAPPASTTLGPPTIHTRDVHTRDVSMQAAPTGTYESIDPVVDQLEPIALLQITADGFAPNTTGFVEQCTDGGCANNFPVIFDGAGRARFQYLVGDTFATGFERPSTCGATGAPCVVHVRAGRTSAYLTTVFRDAAPPPRLVTVAPSARGIVDGAAVRVTATGFNPGEHVQAMLCAAPHTSGSTRCGAPGPISSFTIDAGGMGRTSLVVRDGRVGSAGAPCGRGGTCAIVVSNPQSSVPAPAVPIVFAAGPSTQYEPVRWVTGLSIALALLALALALVRITDWRKPTEADTPALDQAVLAE